MYCCGIFRLKTSSHLAGDQLQVELIYAALEMEKVTAANYEKKNVVPEKISVSENLQAQKCETVNCGQ
jgi:hypothetical protein